MPACPTTVDADPRATVGRHSVLINGTQQDQNLQTVCAQSDYINILQLGGLRHEVLAGVDYALEKKQVYA